MNAVTPPTKISYPNFSISSTQYNVSFLTKKLQKEYKRDKNVYFQDIKQASDTSHRER